MSNMWMRDSMYFTLTVNSIYQGLAVGYVDNIDSILLWVDNCDGPLNRVTWWNGALARVI